MSHSCAVHQHLANPLGENEAGDGNVQKEPEGGKKYFSLS